MEQRAFTSEDYRNAAANLDWIGEFSKWTERETELVKVAIPLLLPKVPALSDDPESLSEAEKVALANTVVDALPI